MRSLFGSDESSYEIHTGEWYCQWYLNTTMAIFQCILDFACIDCSTYVCECVRLLECASVGVYAFVVTSLALTFVFQIIISVYIYIYRHMYIVHSLIPFTWSCVDITFVCVYSVHVGTYDTYVYVDDGLFISVYSSIL